MKVVEIDNNWRDPARIEYKTEETIDIKKAVNVYGRGEDTVELYDDNENLIGLAIWPKGYKVYLYCTNPSEKNCDLRNFVTED